MSKAKNKIKTAWNTSRKGIATHYRISLDLPEGRERKGQITIRFYDTDGTGDELIYVQSWYGTKKYLLEMNEALLGATAHFGHCSTASAWSYDSELVFKGEEVETVFYDTEKEAAEEHYRQEFTALARKYADEMKEIEEREEQERE